MSTSMDGFIDILIRRKVISLDQASEAEQLRRESGQNLQECLLRLGYADGEAVMKAIAEDKDLEYVNLMEVKIPEEVIERVPESVARERVILPMAADEDVLKIIVSDPEDWETQENLRFILNCHIKVALAPRDMIAEAINRYYGQIEGESADSMLQEFTDTAIDFTETTDADFDIDDAIDENSAPLVRLVHMMITEALQLRASDIHVEPFEHRVRVRYRIDGVLIERDDVPRRLLGALLSRIKILSKLDISERRRPQDGRIKVTIGDKDLDLRVSVIPTNHGQSVVMRLLDKDNIKIGVRQLGLSDKNFKQFQNLIARPNGIVLVTGPTGSGKTTTLYASLNALNRPDRKIITAEDPVEYYLPGINQVEIRHDIGLDFARVIKAMLRQAPNVILVGEMRDTETASMGIQASLTGHLVFSTLHTNDAPSAITRMIDMGVPGYLVASSVVAILAQRLVRVICSKCKQSYNPKPHIIEAAGISPEDAANAEFAKGKGCGHCQKKGYRGRIGIYELMMVTSKIREKIFENASAADIRKVAIAQGMSTLYTDGMYKVMQGITTFDEVYRVAKKTEDD